MYNHSDIVFFLVFGANINTEPSFQGLGSAKVASRKLLMAVITTIRMDNASYIIQVVSHRNIINIWLNLQCFNKMRSEAILVGDVSSYIIIPGSAHHYHHPHHSSIDHQVRSLELCDTESKPQHDRKVICHYLRLRCCHCLNMCFRNPPK